VTDLAIKQVRSANGTTPKQRATLGALGLGRIGKRVQRADNDQLRGQLRVVGHLVAVEEAGGEVG
jgi:large subunit ribosomal protein L30